MATATLGLIGHTEIDDADSATDWNTLDTLDPDIKKEGTNSMTGVVRSNGTTFGVTKATAVSCSGEHLRFWVNTINIPYMQPESSNGYEVYVSDGTNTDYVVAFGSDTYNGGWFNLVIDCALFTTVTPANVVTWGMRANHTATAKNADNTWMDYVRYMDGYYITGGTGTSDTVKLSDVAVADKGTTTLYGYGIVEESEGVYFGSGEIQIGNGTTTTYFEMDGDVLVYTDKPVADGLYSLNGNGSGCNISITNSTIKASGTGNNNRPDVDMSTGSPGSVSVTDTVFIRGGAFTLGSGQTWTGCTFNDCEQITAGGADLRGSSVAGYEGTAGTAALLYSVAADPDGELDNMYFEKGTATTHAIEFDATNTPTTIYLRGIDFSGYNASNGQNDSTLYFPSTTKTYTVYLVGCTGNISYRVGTGGTVNLVINPVSFSITVIDNTTKNPIQFVAVTVWATATGNLPHEDSVSITSSGTTATVSHTAHGLSTDQWVEIAGCTQTEYNGIWQITKIDDNSYSYTFPGSGTSPATGTPISTALIINGETNALGQITDSRSYTADQGYSGKALKGSWEPVYQEASITGTLDKDNGASLTVSLVPD